MDAKDFFPFPDSIEFISGASPSPEPFPNKGMSLFKRMYSSDVDLLSDDGVPSQERLSSEQDADITAELISSDRVKALCLKKANLTNHFVGKTFLGSDSNSHPDSKIHIDPLLGGTSPSVSEDLLDDAQLISVVEGVERSQGEQYQPLSQSAPVDQPDRSEKKVDKSSLQSPGKNRPTPDTPATSEDTPSPIPKRKNRLKAAIQVMDHQSNILSRPLAKPPNRPMPIMLEIDDNRNEKSPPFTTGTNLSISERQIIDDPLSLTWPTMSKDRSISRVEATEKSECIENLLLSKGQHQSSSKIQAIDQNQLDITLPIKKTKGKRKLKEYEGIAFLDDKPLSKRAHTTSKKPLRRKDEAYYPQNSCPPNVLSGPSEFKQVNPGRLHPMNDPTNVPGRTDSGVSTMSINHRSRSNVVIDSKSKRNQAEPITIKSDPQTPFIEQDFAKTMLNDFTRRIQNSILRLNKSLLDLPPGPYAREFDLDSVEQHVRMLVEENFYNPHLDNGAAPTGNEHQSREIGHTPNIEVKGAELLSKENNGNTYEGRLTKMEDTPQLDRRGTHNLPLENNRIDDVFRQNPSEFHCNSFHFPF